MSKPFRKTPTPWLVVCVGCLRINRDGHWTDDRVPDTEGCSTGYCDECIASERVRLNTPQSNRAIPDPNASS